MRSRDGMTLFVRARPESESRSEQLRASIIRSHRRNTHVYPCVASAACRRRISLTCHADTCSILRQHADNLVAFHKVPTPLEYVIFHFWAHPPDFFFACGGLTQCMSSRGVISLSSRARTATHHHQCRPADGGGSRAVGRCESAIQSSACAGASCGVRCVSVAGIWRMWRAGARVGRALTSQLAAKDFAFSAPQNAQNFLASRGGRSQISK